MLTVVQEIITIIQIIKFAYDILEFFCKGFVVGKTKVVVIFTIQADIAIFIKPAQKILFVLKNMNM